MKMRYQVPRSVCSLVGEVVGLHYYSHRRLDQLFIEAGAPGEAPEASCVDKCSEWLKRASSDQNVNAYEVLGRVLEEYMDCEPSDRVSTWEKNKERINRALDQHGLKYEVGGKVTGGLPIGPASARLEEIMRQRSLSSLEIEFERASTSVETDPPAALAAASCILEALFKVYIEDEDLKLPAKQTLTELAKVVRKDIRLDPSSVEENDIQRILSGLVSVTDGLAAFRTHASSVHGRGRRSYKVSPRHARLTVNSAHALAVFIIETWEARKQEDAAQTEAQQKRDIRRRDSSFMGLFGAPALRSN